MSAALESMIRRPPVTAAPTETLAEVFGRMEELGVGSVLVVAPGAGNFSIDSASKFDLGKNYLDLQNSGGNVTAIDAIRAVHACLPRSIPTYSLTGDTSPQRILEASELGFPLLHKPVDPNALRQALSQPPVPNRMDGLA